MHKIVISVIGILFFGLSGCQTRDDNDTKPPVVSPVVVPETGAITNGPTLPSKIPWWLDEETENNK